MTNNSNSTNKNTTEHNERLDELLETDPTAGYAADPMAEFEDVESSLDWPDKKKKESDNEATPSLPEEDVAATTTTEKNLNISDDGIDSLDQEAPSESTEQDAINEEPVDSTDLFISDSDLTTKEKELLLPEVETPRERRSLFGRRNKTPKPAKKKKRSRKNKHEPSVNFPSETDNDNHETQRYDEAQIDNHNHHQPSEQIDYQEEDFEQASPDYDSLAQEQYYIEDENPRQGISPSKIAIGVGKVLFSAALLAGITYLYLDVSSLKKSEGQSAFKVREQMLSEMESLESRILETTMGINGEFQKTVAQVEQLKEVIALNETRLEEALERSNNELAVDAIKEMIDVDRSVISKLDASIESLEKKIAELDKKAPAAKASKAAPARKAAIRTIRSVAGYSVFSVDLWGNTPLLVLVKGDQIKRMKKGESIAGWQIVNIDSYQKRATLQKGNVTSHLQG